MWVLRVENSPLALLFSPDRIFLAGGRGKSTERRDAGDPNGPYVRAASIGDTWVKGLAFN